MAGIDKIKGLTNRKFNSNTFLFIITIVLFAVMYIAGMIILRMRGLQSRRCF